MSKDIVLRKSFYFREEESAKLSAYIKQQKILKQLEKLSLDESVMEELTDKILDSNNACIDRIYDEMIQSGIEKTWQYVAKLRMSKKKS